MAREQYLLPQGAAITDAGGAGWGFWADAEYTTSSRQTISTSTRTLFEVDGLGGTTETGYLSTVPATVWSGDNTIMPTEVGEAYSVRIDCAVAPTASSTGYVELQLDIGSGSQINIVARRLNLAKGQGVTHSFSIAFPIFCLDTFNANGGKFYMTPSVSIELWDRRIFLQRTFSP